MLNYFLNITSKLLRKTQKNVVFSLKFMQMQTNPFTLADCLVANMAIAIMKGRVDNGIDFIFRF